MLNDSHCHPRAMVPLVEGEGEEEEEGNRNEGACHE